MSDKVLVDGEVSLVNYADGETSLSNVLDGEANVVVNVGGGGHHYDHYSGSYTVTPSSVEQTLETTDKVMDDDVTVEAVQAGSATTPATIITADPTISVSSGGLITATVSKTQQITPTVIEGYVSAGTTGNVGVSGSATEMLDTQGAQTIHPSTSDQSIASGKYLTGNQTFKAVTVSGLTADKILQGNTVKVGDADDDDRIMSVTGTASGGITPTGTKTITANGTGIDVYSYQYADVAVPNSYSAGDEGKVVSNGELVSQTSDTVTENDTYDTTLIDELTVNVPTGGGGVDLSWLASSTPTPSVRNFFYAIANGTCEHGEVTFTNLPNNAYVDVFTMTNITSPQGFMIIDKDFYQGVSGLPHQSSEASAIFWADKSFTTPAADATDKYLLFVGAVNQTATSAGTAAGVAFLIMDGTTKTRRAFWQWSGKTLQFKCEYANNNQYAPFLRNRPYIWIVW